MTERLHFHFLPSCIGEGNGNPLQYSCLENPRDGGAWWAAVCGVTQSWTRLTRLSSSIFHCVLDHVLFIHSSLGRHIGFFHHLATVNNAAVNVDVQIISSRSSFQFFWVYTQKWNYCIWASQVVLVLRNPPALQ